MAFDLVAKIKLKDEMSSQLKVMNNNLDNVAKSSKVAANTMKQLGETNRLARQTVSSTSSAFDKQSSEIAQARREMDRYGDASKSGTSSLKSFAAAGLGVGTALVGANAAVGIMTAGFNALGAAARKATDFTKYTLKLGAEFEMNKVSFNAMFGNGFEKQAQEYLNYLQVRADISSLELDDFLSAGRSFIPITKDVNELMRATNLMERLAALDPMQGSAGAALALKEMFSGDTQSLVERFELPRKALNEIKNLDVPEMIEELDKLFSKIGASNRLLEDQANTSLGRYNKAIGKVTAAIREMGYKGLDKVNPLLNDFNKFLEGDQFSKMKAWGSDMFSGLLTQAADVVQSVGSYIDTNFLSNAKFQNLTTFSDKVSAMFSQISTDFGIWWESSGRSTFEKVTEKAIDVVGTIAKEAAPTIASIGLEIGKSFAKQLMEGIKAHFNPQSELARQLDSVSKLKEAASKLPEGEPLFKGGVMQAPSVDSQRKKTMWQSTKDTFSSLTDWIPHSGGLDRVPYHRYPALLHKDETVLNATEARKYRGDGGAGSGYGGGVVVNMYGTVIREEADAERLADAIARKLAV